MTDLKAKLEAWAERERAQWVDSEGREHAFDRGVEQMLALLWPVIAAAADDPIMSEEVKQALTELGARLGTRD